MTDPSDFIMQGGAPTFKFSNHGDTAEGEIVDTEVQQQRDFESGLPLTWTDGNPRLQVRIVLATAERGGDLDDGKRSLYVRGAMQAAVREAVRAAGESRIEVGGFLTVVYTGDGEVTRKGFAPPKLFKAKYSAPAAPGIDVEDL